MKKKIIGILGGMGPEALSDMYLGICRYYQTQFGAQYDKDFPAMILYSVPIPDVVESIENERTTLEMLLGAAQTLVDDGCDFVVIACNSVQFLLEDLQESIAVPIIGIAATVANSIGEKGYAKVGILATATTINKKVYDAELRRIGIELVAPSKVQQDAVTQVIMNQLAGRASEKDTQALLEIIEALQADGAEAILLACTDLPLVIQQNDTLVPLVNCTEVYAQEAARMSAV